MKKIFLLSLITLMFSINGVSATEITIPELPIIDLDGIGNTIDNSVVPDISINDSVIDDTNTQLNPVETAPYIEDIENTSQSENPSNNNFLIWGGIIVIGAGGLYLYLSKKDRY